MRPARRSLQVWLSCSWNRGFSIWGFIFMVKWRGSCGTDLRRYTIGGIWK
ncbi:MAG: hypothetical protein ACFFBV_15725 [Promethearchaeota archaeon]